MSLDKDIAQRMKNAVDLNFQGRTYSLRALFVVNKNFSKSIEREEL
jgi:hypothetical protein